METRRQFILKGIKFLTSIGLLFASICTGAYSLWAKTKRVIVPKGTKRQTLIHRNPADLDTRQLHITPLEDFGTMGQTNIAVNIKKWRLEVTGEVNMTLSLTYQEILRIPSLERKVLLICPGVFANHGKWRGISIMRLLKMAGCKEDISHVQIHGSNGSYEKVVKYPIEDILSDKVFLAYEVNGRPLPKKHGFPLRVVAEDYFGYDWIKYVYQLTVLGNNQDRKSRRRKVSFRYCPGSHGWI